MTDAVPAKDRAHALTVQIKTDLETLHGVYGDDVEGAMFVVDVGGRPYEVTVTPRAVVPADGPAVS